MSVHRASMVFTTSYHFLVILFLVGSYYAQYLARELFPDNCPEAVAETTNGLAKATL
ncbi:MAG: hypothetical protein M3305_00920 [Actinomycetota bacterium]|nr:hypothetical protein [Actinomycetota bacterium]